MATHPDYELATEKPSRHGKMRYRFAKGDRPLLPGEPHSPEFDFVYSALLAGKRMPTKEEIAKAIRPNVVVLPSAQPALIIDAKDGTLDGCYGLLRMSKAWKRHGDKTKRIYSSCIEGMLDLPTPVQKHRYGGGKMTEFDREAVEAILATFDDRPYYQATALTCLRSLIGIAIEKRVLKAGAIDPTHGIEPDLPLDSDGHPMWEPEHLEKYEKFWKPGSMQRIAYALALWLGNRVSDVAGLHWDMLKTKKLLINSEYREVTGFEFIQFKGRRFKRGEKIFLPLTTMLARELSGLVHEGYVLKNTWGKRFTAGSLSNGFIKWSRQAGVEIGYSIHGLRKSLLTKMAEAEATDRQLMAVAGWLTAEQVERYTRKANKTRLAVQAFDRLEEIDRRRIRPPLRVVK